MVSEESTVPADDAPPASEAPPPAPITLGGVEVDVSQEGVCSPRRVNMVYAPLATWYNTTGKGAALRAKHAEQLVQEPAFGDQGVHQCGTVGRRRGQGRGPARGGVLHEERSSAHPQPSRMSGVGTEAASAASAPRMKNAYNAWPSP